MKMERHSRIRYCEPLNGSRPDLMAVRDVRSPTSLLLYVVVDVQLGGGGGGMGWVESISFMPHVPRVLSARARLLATL